MRTGQLLADYDDWLGRQALGARTRASYRRWARELAAHLDAGDELAGFLARDGEHDRRAVLGDWRRRLVDRGLAPSTVNLALAAATSLLRADATCSHQSSSWAMTNSSMEAGSTFGVLDSSSRW